MKIIYLNLVFWIANEVKMVYSPSPDRSTPNLERTPSRYLRLKSPFGKIECPCDRTKVNRGEPDAHTKCHTKCFEMRTMVTNYHIANPEHTTVTRIYNKCGLVTEGRCDYWGLGYFPICFCLTPDGMHGHQKTPLFTCRLGIPIMRGLTSKVDEKIYVNEQDETNYKVNLSTEETKVLSGDSIVDGEQERKKKDDEKPGELLVMDMTLTEASITNIPKKLKVMAVVDTGAAVTMINKKLAKFFNPLREKIRIRGASNVKFQVFGRTTVNVLSDDGIIFKLEGLVVDHHFDIVMGNDFNVSHATKINIPEKSMTFFDGLTEVKMALKFIPTSDLVSTVSSNRKVYSPLRVSGWVNGYQTKIMIDTGVSRTVVKKEYVKSKNIRPLDVKLFINEDTKPNVAGVTDVTVSIEGTEFSTLALAVPFKLPNNLLLGNSFIKPYVELIDFGQKIFTFLPFDNNDRTITQMVRIQQN